MAVEASGEKAGSGDPATDAAETESAEHGRGPGAWLRSTNTNPDVIAAIRKARHLLPGDPHFGDPLSTTGDGAPQAAARAAEKLMPEREAATREVSLAGLQVLQALTEGPPGPAPAEVTLVFTDLVGFSNWSLKAGDEATLKLLRLVAQVGEAPLLDAGGHIVKRMGDGMMVVFAGAATAVRATLAAMAAVGTVEVDGFIPRMRAGIHTGRPQSIGADWLGVDVNIAARVMQRAIRGGLIISETTRAEISREELGELGVSFRKVPKQSVAVRQQGVPPELGMYRVKPKPPTLLEGHPVPDQA
ncbi:MAG: adenylate/guanylate cyclase domain-containing protein [Mycobacterium sp.]